MVAAKDAVARNERLDASNAAGPFISIPPLPNNSTSSASAEAGWSWIPAKRDVVDDCWWVGVVIDDFDISGANAKAFWDARKMARNAACWIFMIKLLLRWQQE